MAACGSSLSSTSDIPGYHYDESKKRYFKIPPSHFAELPSLNASSQSQRTAQPVTNFKSKPSPNLSIYNLFHKRQLGIISAWDPRPHFKCVARSLSQCAEVEIPFSYNEIENMWVSEDGSGIVLFYSSAEVVSRSWSMHKLSRGTFSSVSFDVQWNASDRGLDNVSVMDLRLLGSQVDSNVFIVRDGKYHLSPSVINSCINSSYGNWFDFDISKAMYHFTPHSNYVTCLCVSPETTSEYKVFAVGGEIGVINLVQGEKIRKFSCSKRRFRSRVTSLAFGDEGRQLFAGYKNGMIFGWDLRTKYGSCNDPSMSLKEPTKGKVNSSVCAIQPLKDRNYIISSAYNSKLSLWDVRMRAKILHYKGHVNNYRPCRSKLVDNDEKYLFAAGSDRCVRLWSVGDGQLLRTITPAELPPISDRCSNSLPLISYTNTLGGRYNPALIICDHKHLCFFKPST